MPREDKQLPSPPPEAPQSKHPMSKHVKGSSSGSQSKSLPSASSTVSNGQAKRTTFGSSTNGTKKIDPNDDLFIRLLAHKALTESNDTNILTPEEIDELKNVHPLIHSPLVNLYVNSRNNRY